MYEKGHLLVPLDPGAFWQGIVRDVQDGLCDVVYVNGVETKVPQEVMEKIFEPPKRRRSPESFIIEHRQRWRSVLP